MSQGHRISQYQEIEEMLERVRQAHEADEATQAGPAMPIARDGVERSRKNPFGSAPRPPDLHKQMTQNLEMGPASAERFGTSRNDSGRVVVKAESRATDYQGLPPSVEALASARDEDPAGVGAAGAGAGAGAGAEAEPLSASEAAATGTGGDGQGSTGTPADMPEWQRTEQVLEEAVDYNEDVLVPAAKHPLTRATTTQASETASVSASPTNTAAPKSKAPVVADDEAVFLSGLTEHERAFSAAIHEEAAPAACERKAKAAREERRPATRPAQTSGPTHRAEKTPTADEEATSPGFEYHDKGRLIAELAKGIEVKSGEGASYDDRNRTQTHVRVPRPATKRG